MKPLFSENSLVFLESLAFTKTLFAFDFDGTLSKIVPVPSEATISPKTSALLEQLSRVAPVGVLSGRSLRDLKTRLQFQPQFLVGNHGLEGAGVGPNALEESRRICEGWKKNLQTLLKKYRDPGLQIEDKDFSIAVHYRRCRSRKEMKTAILNVISQLKPLPRVIVGKAVVNLVPAGAPHKGIALVNMMERANVQTALYVGDDDTDEDVFSMPDARLFTIRVGRKRASQARYYVSQQGDVNRLISMLIEFHETSKSPRSEIREFRHARA